MVNWDPKALTALSDEEVIYKEQQGSLFYLKYKIETPETSDRNEYAVVATTRPETILGDTAMCINPNDPKNAYLKGKKVIVPLINRVIPVIEDEYVDIEFGTGCLKVTPAHDVNDYMLGEKFNLPIIDIFNDNGTLNEHGQMYAGMDRFEVRKQIVKDLEAVGLLEKVEPYTNKVGFSERTNVVIEPKLSMQWFLKMENLAKPALDTVMNDEIKLVPPKFKNTYRHWMENVKDWCISRQLWWGHRIPAYYLPKGGHVVALTKKEAYKDALSIVNYPLSIDDLIQDEDVLDTWFSSWLWPISVFDGINHPDNPDIKYYYPTADLVTAPDILFFWVARMIISGYEYRQQPCFHHVYLTGIVRDKLGRKMSKSLGNSPEPLSLIEKYGADGVRMGMMLAAPAGNDILFDESLCEQGRNFNNKIWNALRLIKGWEIANIPQPESSVLAIRWFDAKLSQTIIEVNDLFDKYRISEALMVVYKLFWDDFSAWYLELIKPAYQQPIDKATEKTTIEFFEKLLKLLHPFMPFITEELYHALKKRSENDSIMVSLLPQAGTIDTTLLTVFDNAKEIIAGIRTIRLQKNIPNKESLELQIMNEQQVSLSAVILKMANLSKIEIVKDKASGASSFMVGTIEYAVPLGKMIDVEVEIKKLNDELAYQQGFLISVNKKLDNEKFVANAKPEVVEMERKKLTDAESKIVSIKETMAALKTL
jgi:valyl-tRNA synthetase